MPCWMLVACEARPARACAIASLTLATSSAGIDEGAGGSAAAGSGESDCEIDAVAAPFLPLAVFFSFFSFLSFLPADLLAFLLSFLEGSALVSLALAVVAFLPFVLSFLAFAV